MTLYAKLQADENAAPHDLNVTLPAQLSKTQQRSKTLTALPAKPTAADVLAVSVLPDVDALSLNNGAAHSSRLPALLQQRQQKHEHSYEAWRLQVREIDASINHEQSSVLQAVKDASNTYQQSVEAEVSRWAGSTAGQSASALAPLTRPEVDNVVQSFESSYSAHIASLQQSLQQLQSVEAQRHQRIEQLLEMTLEQMQSIGHRQLHEIEAELQSDVSQLNQAYTINVAELHTLSEVLLKEQQSKWQQTYQPAVQQLFVQWQTAHQNHLLSSIKQRMQQLVDAASVRCQTVYSRWRDEQQLLMQRVNDMLQSLYKPIASQSSCNVPASSQINDKLHTVTSHLEQYFDSIERYVHELTVDEKQLHDQLTGYAAGQRDVVHSTGLHTEYNQVDELLRSSILDDESSRHSNALSHCQQLHSATKHNTKQYQLHITNILQLYLQYSTEIEQYNHSVESSHQRCTAQLQQLYADHQQKLQQIEDELALLVTKLQQAPTELAVSDTFAQISGLLQTESASGTAGTSQQLYQQLLAVSTDAMQQHQQQLHTLHATALDHLTYLHSYQCYETQYGRALRAQQAADTIAAVAASKRQQEDAEDQAITDLKQRAKAVAGREKQRQKEQKAKEDAEAPARPTTSLKPAQGKQHKRQPTISLPTVVESTLTLCEHESYAERVFILKPIEALMQQQLLSSVETPAVAQQAIPASTLATPRTPASKPASPNARSNRPSYATAMESAAAPRPQSKGSKKLSKAEAAAEAERVALEQAEQLRLQAAEEAKQLELRKAQMIPSDTVLTLQVDRAELTTGLSSTIQSMLSAVLANYHQQIVPNIQSITQSRTDALQAEYNTTLEHLAPRLIRTEVDIKEARQHQLRVNGDKFQRTMEHQQQCTQVTVKSVEQLIVTLQQALGSYEGIVAEQTVALERTTFTAMQEIETLYRAIKLEGQKLTALADITSQEVEKLTAAALKQQQLATLQYIQQCRQQQFQLRTPGSNALYHADEIEAYTKAIDHVTQQCQQQYDALKTRLQDTQQQCTTVCQLSTLTTVYNTAKQQLSVTYALGEMYGKPLRTCGIRCNEVYDQHRSNVDALSRKIDELSALMDAAEASTSTDLAAVTAVVQHLATNVQPTLLQHAQYLLNMQPDLQLPTMSPTVLGQPTPTTLLQAVQQIDDTLVPPATATKKKLTSKSSNAESAAATGLTTPTSGKRSIAAASTTASTPATMLAAVTQHVDTARAAYLVLMSEYEAKKQLESAPPPPKSADKKIKPAVKKPTSKQKAREEVPAPTQTLPPAVEQQLQAYVVTFQRSRLPEYQSQLVQQVHRVYELMLDRWSTTVVKVVERVVEGQRTAKSAELQAEAQSTLARRLELYNATVSELRPRNAHLSPTMLPQVTAAEEQEHRQMNNTLNQQHNALITSLSQSHEQHTTEVLYCVHLLYAAFDSLMLPTDLTVTDDAMHRQLCQSLNYYKLLSEHYTALRVCRQQELHQADVEKAVKDAQAAAAKSTKKGAPAQKAVSKDVKRSKDAAPAPAEATALPTAADVPLPQLPSYAQFRLQSCSYAGLPLTQMTFPPLAEVTSPPATASAADTAKDATKGKAKNAAQRASKDGATVSVEKPASGAAAKRNAAIGGRKQADAGSSLTTLPETSPTVTHINTALHVALTRSRDEDYQHHVQHLQQLIDSEVAAHIQRLAEEGIRHSNVMQLVASMQTH